MLRRTALRRCTVFKVPTPTNEPLMHYREGSPERAKLFTALETLKTKKWNIPCVVNGIQYREGAARVKMTPSDIHTPLCVYHFATPELLEKAIEASIAAQAVWRTFDFHHRAAIFLRAAHLLSTVYRYDIMAATMLGQSKNIWQAEIDAGAELVDFLRFNCHFAESIYSRQPYSPKDCSVWNYMDYRPLEGFVLAISPFNFTAIGGNLATAPALMGNTVIWKPSEGSVLANYLTFKVLVEAGMPPGVINFVPSAMPDINAIVTPHRMMAGLAFTGSTRSFSELWRTIASTVETHISFPRVVGECSAKNFHLVHKSADIQEVVACTIRSAFEYQGQKCSSCSRMYIPRSLYGDIILRLVYLANNLKVGQPTDPKSFMCAVIDQKAYDRVAGYLERARGDPTCTVMAGGTPDQSVGWFVPPTVIVVKNPKHELMQEGIFGPVLAVYVYEDEDWEATLKLIDDIKYSLSGSLFCNDRNVVVETSEKLRNACGNFFINDKSTGAIVGQQPFGGSRCSGTNDKAGSEQFLNRWISVRSVKETFQKGGKIMYPHQE